MEEIMTTYNLKIFSLLIMICFIFLSNLNANSFSKSKRILLKKVYFDNQYTFYCGNPYEIKQIDGKEKTVIIKDKKYFTSRNDSFFNFWNDNERAKIVEWDHVMPVEYFAKDLPCWKEGGRKACAKDETFKIMEADMHNLVPAIGEINNDKSNFRFGEKLPKKGQYGNCEIEIDSKNKIVYPRVEIRGDIARIYLYMSKTYNIKLSKEDKKMFKKWDEEDPISQFEKIKNEKIHNIIE
jgi:deoxyribonuclease-1